MVLSLDRWVGKVAVVTGVSAGIGEAIAEFLVKNGIIVAGIARRIDRVEQKARQLANEKGKLHPIQADISKEDDIVKAFKEVDAKLGPVHILINNAGVAKENFLCNGSADDWRATFDVNVIGLCIATREAVTRMRANNINGHIVHINSDLGHQVKNLPSLNVYPATKFAVTALAETLKHELNHFNSKIKITSLSPGLVATELTTLNTGFSEQRKNALKNAPIISPQDIAEAVGYVLSTPENVQINELTITPLAQHF